VLAQPSDKGTGAGVLLGLVHVAETDPDSMVVVTPSDHGVANDTLFRNGLLAAARTIRSKTASCVLLGVRPDSPCPDYGWITPSPSARDSALALVESFVEKPSREEAARLLSRGGAWSTMVLVARTSSLIELYRRTLPHIHGAFAGLGRSLGEDRRPLLDAVYAAIPHSDFSRDVLAAARELRLLVWPETMGWTDLGTPERLQAWKQASMRQPGSISAA
jgi:mannose-1-phosphate guanylyltransferase